NFITSTKPRNNVKAGTHSVSNQEGYVSIGQEWLYGLQPRPIFAPKCFSILTSWGAQASGPTTDMLGLTRPTGMVRVVATGTATSGAAKTITDSGATWSTNAFTAYYVKITGGTGSGQIKHIDTNTATA